MANNLTGLFQTIVAAASAAADSLKYENAFLKGIYWDFKPVVATPNTNLSVIIPTVDEADVTDIGSGSLNVTDTDHNQVLIPYNHHYSTSFIIKAFDQNRTPQQLQRTYLQPRMEALRRAVNRTVCQQFTTANFGTGSSLSPPGFAMASGATSGYFVRSDLTPLWATLANEGVPVNERNNMFFFTTPSAYGGMLSDQTMSYSYIVGEKAGELARENAKLSMTIGAEPLYDQHLALLQYQNGFTSGKQAGILAHRYAVAAVTAQPPPTDPAQSHIEEEIVWLDDVLPVQLQMAFSLEKQGTIVHLHCYWGVAPARADYAAFISSN